MMKQKSTANKRGQVTLFIILGIIILIILSMGLYFYQSEVTSFFKTTLGSTIESSSTDQPEIYEIAQDCLEFYADQGIEKIQLQGGYIELPEQYLETDISNVAYSYYNENTLLSLENIEESLSNYIKDNLTPNCFSTDEYTIEETDRINVETEIKDGIIVIEVEWPLKFTKTNLNFDLPDMGYSPSSELKALHTNLGQMLENPDMIDYNLQYYQTTGINKTIIPYNQSKLIILNKEGTYFITAISMVEKAL